MLLVANIGYWTAELHALWIRYAGVYGPKVEIIVYECDETQARDFERKVHEALSPFHYGFELYHKTPEAREVFYNTASSLCKDVVRMPTRSPIYKPKKRHVKSIEFDRFFAQRTPLKFQFQGLASISQDTAWQIKNTCFCTEKESWELRKFLFCKHIIDDSDLDIRCQAVLFDHVNANRDHARWLFEAHQTGLAKLLQDDVISFIYPEYTVHNRSIAGQCHEMISLLGLESGHDTSHVLSRQQMEQARERLLPLVKTLRQALYKDSRPSRAKPKKSGDVSGDGPTISQMVCSVNVVLKTWFGTSLHNIDKDVRKSSNGKQSRLGSYKLQYADDFSRILYTCGILDFHDRDSP